MPSPLRTRLDRARRRARLAARDATRPRSGARVAGVIAGLELGGAEVIRPADEVLRRPGRRAAGAQDATLATSTSHAVPAGFRITLAGGRLAGRAALVLTACLPVGRESPHDEEQLASSGVLRRRLHRARRRPGRHHALTGQWA